MSHELQVAFEVSRSNQSYQDYLAANAIAEQLAAGRFVVTYNAMAYCPYTDATIGMAASFVEAFDTREDAEAYKTSLPKDDTGESYNETLPRLPKPVGIFSPFVAREVGFDDIPF